MYHYKIGIPASEHDDFVRNSSQPNLLQSSKWAHIKKNWGNERIGFYRNGELVAVASILIKKLPLGYTMMYIPRGPIMDYQDKDLVTFVMRSLKQFGASRRSVFIKFDPSLILKQYPIDKSSKEFSENSTTIEAIQNLKDANCQWSGRTIAMSETIQPRYQANRILKEGLDSDFPKHTKRLMKDAVNRGVVTYRGTLSDVSDFGTIISFTERRKNVALRNQEYFQRLMEIYGDAAYLHLAKINLPDRLMKYKEQLFQIKKDLGETGEHQKKRLTKLKQQEKSIEKYIIEFEELVQQYPKEIVIAGILSVSFGNTLEMLYAGMDDRFKKFYPQYILYPKVFEESYKDGKIWANMGGIEGTLDDGLTDFKSNFSPVVQEYIGEFTLPVNFLYHLANYFYQLRKILRKKHRK